MPLTRVQSQEQFIVRSLMAYLVSTVVTPYNTEVASTSFPKALGIELEWPDDPAKSPDMPVIIIDEPIDAANQISLGLGQGEVWKTKQFRLYCFPANTTENKPSITAAAVLRNYLDYALGSGLYFPIYDYSVVPAVQSEAARIVSSKIMKSAKSFAPLMAIEKHRFDYLLTICYPVVAING